MDFFIARQPIFDRNKDVFAYELLFRSGPDNYFELRNKQKESGEVVTNSLLYIGLEELTSGKKACINFAHNLLEDDVATVLPSSMMIVEILDEFEPDEQFLAECKKLKDGGYTLAFAVETLQDYTDPIQDLADIIKVDFSETPSPERKEIANKFDSGHIQLLAEKVDTIEDFNQANKLGYTYFQGYFFDKPEFNGSGTAIPEYKINYLRMLQEIHQPEIEYSELENVIRRDLDLTYKLLRFINSSYFGVITEVRSIKQALVLLGFDEIRKWVSLTLLDNLAKDKPSELIRQSILRAKFCEEIAERVGKSEESAEFFLMGMFTAINALINKPMAQILAELPLANDMKVALLGRNNRYRKVLEAVLAYERGDWYQFDHYAKELKLDSSEVPAIYNAALQWVDQVS